MAAHANRTALASKPLGGATSLDRGAYLLRPGVSGRDDLAYDARRARTSLWIGGLVVGLLATIVVAVGLGPVAISPATVFRVIAHHLLGWPADTGAAVAQDDIVWNVRLPRVLLGAIVGAGLSASGAALQAMVRNILADPYLLGVTSGASTGAAATILFGVGAGISGVAIGGSVLTGTAFIGAIGAMAIVFVIARINGKITPTRMLLAGVAVGYVLAAITSFMIFSTDSPTAASSVLFWILGSLSYAVWQSVLVAGSIVVIMIVVIVFWSRRLDALAIGDETAQALGMSPSRVRTQLLVVVAIGVGAVVAVSGGIGFVGLVVPHVARRCVGGVNRRVVPVTALIGAIFLIWCDTLARVIFAPAELPLGIITAVVGAPLLFILIRKFYSPTT